MMVATICTSVRTWSNVGRRRGGDPPLGPLRCSVMLDTPSFHGWFGLRPPRDSALAGPRGVRNFRHGGAYVKGTLPARADPPRITNSSSRSFHERWSATSRDSALAGPRGARDFSRREVSLQRTVRSPLTTQFTDANGVRRELAVVNVGTRTDAQTDHYAYLV